MFVADLLRALHRVGLEPQVEFFHLSSYLSGTISSGTVKILRDIDPRSATAMCCLSTTFWNGPGTCLRQGSSRGPRRASGSRVYDAGEARQAGGRNRRRLRRLRLPRRFVVGYGMDVAHWYRELPFIGRVVTAQDLPTTPFGIRHACLRVVFSLSRRWAILRMGARAWSNCAPNWRSWACRLDRPARGRAPERIRARERRAAEMADRFAG